MKFSGVSAFPITPMNEKGVDQPGFERLIRRLVDAGVDSIGVEGSTGNYPYLTFHERLEIARVAVSCAQETPVIASIGAFRTRDVLTLAEHLQTIGISALLLPIVSYHCLREEEVFSLFRSVSQNVSVPVIIYDSPVISRFAFSDMLYARICALPHIGSIKVPSGWPNRKEAAQRIARLAQTLPSTTIIGASGDDTLSEGVRAGAKIWYSEWGGLFPQKAKGLMQAALTGDDAQLSRLSEQFRSFWDISCRYGGSIRPISAAASILGLTDRDNLPLPLHGVSDEDRALLEQAITRHSMN